MPCTRMKVTHVCAMVFAVVIFECIGIANAQPSLSIGSVPGYPGLTVSVPVTVRKVTNVAAAQFEFTYASAQNQPRPELDEL